MSNVRLYPPRGLIVTPNGAATQEMAIYLQQVVRAIVELSRDAAINTAYVHTQSAPAAVWTIDHNLGYWPDVAIFNASGSVVGATITNPTVNRTTISFTTGAIAGVARLT